MDDSRPPREAAFERLCEIESAGGLLEYDVDGWCVWPVLRSAVAARLETRAAPLGAASRRAVGALQGLSGLLRLRRADSLVRTYVSGLLDEEAGHYRDIWFDDLIPHLGGTFKIEGNNNPAFSDRRERALLPRDLDAEPITALAAALTAAAGDRGVRRVAEEISAKLTAHPELAGFTPTAVARRIQGFRMQRRVYGWVLGAVRPRRVLVADSFDHGLIAAAQERGVRTVELQHGVSDRFHAAYGWPDYAAPYRQAMPIAQRLFLHGEHWRNELARGRFWEDAARVVGSPRIDRLRARVAPRDDAGGPMILFTSQGLDTRAVAEMLGEFLSLTRDLAALRLVVKLHPVFDQTRSPYDAGVGRDPRVEVRLATEGESASELLLRADLHLSVSSGTHYEALALGVPTVILPFSFHETVLPLHRAGHAFLASTPAELAALAHGWRDLHVSAEVGEHYFAPDARENILRELDGMDPSPPTRANRLLARS